MSARTHARFAAIASAQFGIATLVFVGTLVSRLPAGAPSDFAKQPALYLPWLASIADTFLWTPVLISPSAALFLGVPFALAEALSAVDAQLARMAMAFGVGAFFFINQWC